MDLRLPYDLDATDTLPDPEQIDQRLEKCWALLDNFAGQIRATIQYRVNKAGGACRDCQYLIEESIKDSLLAVHSQQSDMELSIVQPIIHGVGRAEGMASVAGIDLGTSAADLDSAPLQAVVFHAVGSAADNISSSGRRVTPMLVPGPSYGHWLGVLYDRAGSQDDWFVCTGAAGVRSCMTRRSALSVIAAGGAAYPVYGPVSSASACSRALKMLPY